MKLVDKMNIYLADQQAMYIKLHNLHWYVKGNQFFVLHAKFEELYNSVASVIDDVAERILMIGGSPVASLKKSLEISTIEELEDKPIDSKEAIKVLLTDVKATIKSIKELIELADDEDDDVTEDIFIEYLNEYEKLQWMLEAYSA